MKGIKTNRTMQTADVGKKSVTEFSSKTIKPKTSRPYSAYTSSHTKQIKDYRISEYEVYTGLRNKISNAFVNTQTKLYRELKQLNKKLDPKYSKKMEKLFEKYCIKAPSNKKLASGSVDLEFITKTYVEEKNQRQKKNHSISLIKQDIERVANGEVLFSLQQPQFFEISRSSLQNFEEKTKRKRRDPIKKHPVLKIFDQESKTICDEYKSGQLDLTIHPIYDPYNDEKIDQTEVRNERLQKLNQIKQLKNNISMLRQRRPKSKLHPNKTFFLT